MRTGKNSEFAVLCCVADSVALHLPANSGKTEMSVFLTVSSGLCRVRCLLLTSTRMCKSKFYFVAWH